MQSCCWVNLEVENLPDGHRRTNGGREIGLRRQADLLWGSATPIIEDWRSRMTGETL